MTLQEYNNRFTFGIDRMRHVVLAFGACNESFNQRYTVNQLCVLHKAWMLSGWDVPPDRWEVRQVKGALRGIVPTWGDDERPVYP